MKRDMVYIRIATVLFVLLITFSMFRLWENSITLKERIRITTEALHMEMKQKLNSMMTYKAVSYTHLDVYKRQVFHRTQLYSVLRAGSDSRG